MMDVRYPSPLRNALLDFSEGRSAAIQEKANKRRG
jgi:hypothetical protein